MTNNTEKQVEKPNFYEFLNKPEIKPYQSTVDGKALFEDLIRTIPRYAVLDGYYSKTTALWIMHSYVYSKFAYSPRLNITSAHKGCGKSTVLQIVGLLANKPYQAESITKSSFVRDVDAYKPTILIDEVDEMFKDKENGHTLVAVLNGGYGYNGTVISSVARGNTWQSKRYETFCPVALSGIKDIPLPALASRCIVLRLQKVLKYKIKQKEKLKTHKREYRKHFEELQSKLLRWSQDVELDDDVEMPDDWEARFCDNWRPLFAIAKSFDCEQMVIETANNFIEEDDDDKNLKVLKDALEVFDEEKKWSSEFCAELNTETYYQIFNFSKGITPDNLAKLLKPFGIRPKSIRKGEKTYKGYERKQFVPHWQAHGWVDDTGLQGKETLMYSRNKGWRM